MMRQVLEKKLGWGTLTLLRDENIENKLLVTGNPIDGEIGFTFVHTIDPHETIEVAMIEILMECQAHLIALGTMEREHMKSCHIQ